MTPTVPDLSLVQIPPYLVEHSQEYAGKGMLCADRKDG